MTKDEHKATIVTQLQQQSLNLLVDSLAAALAEIETLKAAAAAPADKP
jgi:lambda repressor-like predicted transcriptional regulator